MHHPGNSMNQPLDFAALRCLAWILSGGYRSQIPRIPQWESEASDINVIDNPDNSERVVKVGRGRPARINGGVQGKVVDRHSKEFGNPATTLF
jgi:hypothetical protein